MPLIKVQTSVSQPEKDKIDSLLKNLSSGMAKHFGKPESYVMTTFESDIPMTFGGSSDEPVMDNYLWLKLRGLNIRKSDFFFLLKRRGLNRMD
ncbi:MAG: hypothetical protein F6K24_46430 [Okeania sp. SIO2D1]|nr:hypothetical protein [Okeania sp. SIO2D1]